MLDQRKRVRDEFAAFLKISEPEQAIKLSQLAKTYPDITQRKEFYEFYVEYLAKNGKKPTLKDRLIIQKINEEERLQKQRKTTIQPKTSPVPSDETEFNQFVDNFPLVAKVWNDPNASPVAQQHAKEFLTEQLRGIVSNPFDRSEGTSNTSDQRAVNPDMKHRPESGISRTELYFPSEKGGRSTEFGEMDEALKIIDAHWKNPICPSVSNPVVHYQDALEEKWATYFNPSVRAQKITDAIKAELPTVSADDAKFIGDAFNYTLSQTQKSLFTWEAKDVQDIFYRASHPSDADPPSPYAKTNDITMAALQMRIRSRILHNFEREKWQSIWKGMEENIFQITTKPKPKVINEAIRRTCTLQTYGLYLQHDDKNKLLYLPENPTVPFGMVNFIAPTEARYITSTKDRFMRYVELQTRLNKMAIERETAVTSPPNFAQMQNIAGRLILSRFGTAQGRKSENIARKKSENYYEINKLQPTDETAPLIIVPSPKFKSVLFDYKTHTLTDLTIKTQGDTESDLITYPSTEFKQKNIDDFLGVSSDDLLAMALRRKKMQIAQVVRTLNTEERMANILSSTESLSTAREIVERNISGIKKNVGDDNTVEMQLLPLIKAITEGTQAMTKWCVPPPMDPKTGQPKDVEMHTERFLANKFKEHHWRFTFTKCRDVGSEPHHLLITTAPLFSPFIPDPSSPLGGRIHFNSKYYDVTDRGDVERIIAKPTKNQIDADEKKIADWKLVEYADNVPLVTRVAVGEALLHKLLYLPDDKTPYSSAIVPLDTVKGNASTRDRSKGERSTAMNELTDAFVANARMQMSALSSEHVTITLPLQKALATYTKCSDGSKDPKCVDAKKEVDLWIADQKPSRDTVCIAQKIVASSLFDETRQHVTVNGLQTFPVQLQVVRALRGGILIPDAGKKPMVSTAVDWITIPMAGKTAVSVKARRPSRDSAFQREVREMSERGADKDAIAIREEMEMTEATKTGSRLREIDHIGLLFNYHRSSGVREYTTFLQNVAQVQKDAVDFCLYGKGKN